MVVLSSRLMWSSLKVSGVRDSETRGRREATAELVESEEAIVMQKEVDVDIR